MASNIVAEVAQMLVTASSPGSAVGIKEANVKLLEYKQKPGYLTILMQIYNTPNVAPQVCFFCVISYVLLPFHQLYNDILAVDDTDIIALTPLPYSLCFLSICYMLPLFSCVYLLR